jgi:hypothetical protein
MVSADDGACAAPAITPETTGRDRSNEQVVEMGRKPTGNPGNNPGGMDSMYVDVYIGAILPLDRPLQLHQKQQDLRPCDRVSRIAATEGSPGFQRKSLQKSGELT